MRSVLVLISAMLLLTQVGCGSDSSDNDSPDNALYSDKIVDPGVRQNPELGNSSSNEYQRSSKMELRLEGGDQQVVNQIVSRQVGELVNEIPSLYGYHSQYSAPYIIQRSYSSTNGEPEKQTLVNYISTGQQRTHLIRHDVVDHVYSTEQFNQSRMTSTNPDPTTIISGQINRYSDEQILFSYPSGTLTGEGSRTSQMTILGMQEVNVQAGRYTAVRFDVSEQEQRNLDNGSGYALSANTAMWLEAQSGELLLMISNGTIIYRSIPFTVFDMTLTQEATYSSLLPDPNAKQQQQILTPDYSMLSRKATASYNQFIAKAHRYIEQ